MPRRVCLPRRPRWALKPDAVSLLIPPRRRLFFGVGFLGAYTTFSTYVFEDFSVMEKGPWLPGMGNLPGSTAVGRDVYLAKMAVMQVEWLAHVMNEG